MKPTLPIKNLVRLNWLLIAAFSTVFFGLSFFLLAETEIHKLLLTAMTGLALGLVGFANVGVLIILARQFDARTTAFKWRRYIFTYAASAVIYIVLSPMFDYISPKTYSYSYPFHLSLFVVSSTVVNSLIILLQNFVILQSNKANADLEISKLKTAHAEAANLLLKQQIHPHFLFNALNTLKALYRKDQGAGDAYMEHLANFLRASVFSHAAKVSSLDDELKLLGDYLEMQKIRFGTALDCTVNLPEEILKARYLPSFSLQPLLENAIKHNELTQQAPLVVHIYYLEERIIVKNNLKKKNMNVSSANHGLANLAERYRLLSGDEVIIREDISTFSVSIKLLTDGYSDNRG